MYYDLLLHVDTDDASLATALRNAENYANAGITESYTIAFVINGKAVELLRDGACAHKPAIARLTAPNVHFFVCNNALKERGMTPADIIKEAEIVPAGIVHLVKLEREGFAYVKP
jgi:uncharacterized protein